MKKTISLFLCLCMMFALAACGGKNAADTSSSGSGYIDKYAKNGEIPELEVKLGTSVEDFKKMFPADSENADESKVTLFEQAGEISVCLATLDAYYYYEKDKKDNGISAIAVTTGKVFGLEIGGTTTKSDVTALLAAEHEESVASYDRQFFIYQPYDDCKLLTAEFGKYRLDFFFLDDFLIGAVLCDTENWTV